MYSTPQDVRNKLHGIPSRVTDEMITRHIEDADTLIDSYLSGVYQIPFSPVPKIISYLSSEISTYNLSFSLFTSQQPNMDGYSESRYQKAIETLEKLANGQIVIPELQNESQSTGFATTNNDEPFFTLSKPYW